MLDEGVAERLAGAQVRHAGDAAGQHEHVVGVEVKVILGDAAVAHDGHVAGRGDLEVFCDRNHIARDARAEKQVDDGDGLDLLESRGKEDRDALIGKLLECHGASLAKAPPKGAGHGRT